MSGRCLNPSELRIGNCCNRFDWARVCLLAGIRWLGFGYRRCALGVGLGWGAGATRTICGLGSLNSGSGSVAYTMALLV